MTLAGVLKKLTLWELLQGMFVVMKSQFRRKVTVQYPKERIPLRPRFRGVPRLRYHPETGEELCISCLMCEQICPDDCISIDWEKVPGKGRVLKGFTIDYQRCCLCGLCVDPCPTKPLTAIYMSHDFELAGDDRQQLVTERHDLHEGREVTVYTR
ncbi:MAG: NuoI/complex I 23 kDa subunit family protein [Acidobacteriota bacterium]